MEIQYFGGNCVKIAGKKSSLVIDDNLPVLGQKSITGEKDIAVYTGKALESDNTKARFVVDGPGEYEVAEVSISGVSARAHIDEEKTQNATMYKIVMDDVRIAVVGHVYPDLSEDQLEALGTIDVLIVPIGGSGYTLDGIGAHKVITKIDPKLVIPTHYHDPKLSYEVPQAELEDAIKSLGIDVSETVESLKLKNTEFTDTTKLIVVKRKS